MASKVPAACDCIAGGNQDKPKQHGADPHAKNCAIYQVPFGGLKLMEALRPTGDDPAEARAPYRMWCLPAPFRKNGTPVLGTFGASEKQVVIFTVETWQRLCADVPQLQTTMFEVGHYD